MSTIRNSLILIILLYGCMSGPAKDRAVGGPKGYDLSSPEKFVMPERLLEISGISFNNGNPDTLYAEQDEEGRIFSIHLGDKKHFSAKFGKHGDYEDLAILDGTVIMLRSDGTLFSFPLGDASKEDIPGVHEWEDLLPDGEFEGLFGDAASHSLYVLCKKCHADKNSSILSGVILKIQNDSTIVNTGTFAIETAPIASFAGGNNFRFAPSGLAKNPATGEWFILSSVNKLLVITDAAFKVKETFHLDAATYRQPEGICFDRDNNLYISNEGDELTNGNVLKIPYKKIN